MLILGIETSTPTTSVVLGGERGTLAAARLGTGRASHDQIAPVLRYLLRVTGHEPASLTGIAVGLGPGLFTGMRVGIATARTMGQALGVPLSGHASLDVLAFAVRHARRRICAAIDARRGELFYAFYRPVPGGVARQGDFRVGPPDGLVAELAARPEDVLVVGDGALAHRRALGEAGTHVEVAPAMYAHPSAEALVELAVHRFTREDFDQPFEVQPIYLRKSDAEIAWDRRRGSA